MTTHFFRFTRRPPVKGFPECHLTSFPCKTSKKKYSISTSSTATFQGIKRLALALLISGISTGCITDTTVDLIKAPFDASTELTDATTGSISQLTDGTSQATTDLTEPTREFLSSTTPGAWFNANGTLNPDHKKIAFIVLNFDNLQENIAHGGGEYLISLSTLLGVPLESRGSFMNFAQGQYGHIYEEGQTRPESLRRLIRTLQIVEVSS